jgi:hypothetical protein
MPSKIYRRSRTYSSILEVNFNDGGGGAISGIFSITSFFDFLREGERNPSAVLRGNGARRNGIKGGSERWASRVYAVVP